MMIGDRTCLADKFGRGGAQQLGDGGFAVWDANVEDGGRRPGLMQQQWHYLSCASVGRQRAVH